MRPSEVWLVRHGETEWSRDGRHTGRTDVPLTELGREQARALGAQLAGRQFDVVLTSPLSRAAESCRLAGFGAAEVRDDLTEWDYGAYEGRTAADIREERRGWNLWRDGVPDGESAEDVGARVERVVEELRAGGDALVFAHGHLLRVLAVRWVGLGPQDGMRLALDTGTISVLGYHRETPLIKLWNAERLSTR